MPLRPCLGFNGEHCGKLVTTRRCKGCEAARNRARDALRGSPTERGLGAAHRRQVAALIASMGGLPENCPRCERPFTHENPPSGEHGLARAHGGTKVTEIVCKSCNSRAGARIRRGA